MQYQTSTSRPQLSLFDGVIAQSLAPFGSLAPRSKPEQEKKDHLSELSLSGSSQHCHLLLTPILRELGDATDSRWLTLIAPPAFLSQSFLRKCGLNRERIILLQPRNAQGALELACKALASGCSHTVISWLGQIDDATRIKLRNAASLGGAQSLNIRLGC
ncbi:SOS-induced cell division inhibitor SulA [Stutzerimonas stutzeri]|uniref:SOS-induced cell division inhibitor SulA n=1 Tax=Stutzerimonas stutzeri TaxID=316 RepID=UPI00066BA008|nr:SOS-induced cell division inhibitor SulA [Stutzerimonas stutzeri]HAG18435.1 cell division protein [Pseudomonas sp.]MDH0182136.1 SulA-like leucine-rich domain-containing protein [Stutzerimonas stutzeri]MDH0499377.1 SulA-like leucine-rich domain-containing protein [Stutzerimonas stutzeri]MDH1248964.1 SulA-like leucine-rich domain-containing protein [Stutzerimonas stutzeri]RRW03441.1 cell division protein [Stutzerimonas stutzeri]